MIDEQQALSNPCFSIIPGYESYIISPDSQGLMLIALTGTPGTGKSAVSDWLKERGLKVLSLGELAKNEGLLVQLDPERGSYEIDPVALLPPLQTYRGSEVVIVEGHLSHLVSPDLTIVLRCHPRTLGSRLRGRGWPEQKVRENLEAEAVDVILVEALGEKAPVFEIDTTDREIGQVGTAILEILEGKSEKYRPGHVDWSEEVLQWY